MNFYYDSQRPSRAREKALMIRRCYYDIKIIKGIIFRDSRRTGANFIPYRRVLLIHHYSQKSSGTNFVME